jgi:hypothetical protein
MALSDFCDCVNCGEEFFGLGGMLRCSGCQATRAEAVTVTRDRRANLGIPLARICSAGSGCRQAANFSIPDAQYVSSGVRPSSVECGRRAL